MGKIAKNKRAILISLLVLLILSWIFTPFWHSYSREYPRSSIYDYGEYGSGYLTINPETILAALNEGETNVFLPDERGYTVINKLWYGPVLNELPTPWSQADYLLIANAVSQFIFHDPLENWSLYAISFEGRCNDGFEGFRQGRFVFFKTIFAAGHFSYMTRFMDIRPQYLSVYWGEAPFPRPLRGWKGFDFDLAKLSADDVLKIAKENVGNDYKYLNDPNCSVGAYLWPEAFDYWDVLVGGIDFEIDPDTGEILKTFNWDE